MSCTFLRCGSHFLLPPSSSLFHFVSFQIHSPEETAYSTNLNSPKMALQPTPYYNEEALNLYISDIKAGAYEASVDHFWSNLLSLYFPLSNSTVETESYTALPESKRRANIAVTNIRGGVRHKIIIVEAKRSPTSKSKEPAYDWKTPKNQLSTYMKDSRSRLGNIQDMYGLVAVGTKVRFYQLKCDKTELSAWPGGKKNPEPTYHLETDKEIIHNHMLEIKKAVGDEQLEAELQTRRKKEGTEGRAARAAARAEEREQRSVSSSRN
ncbi:hypothetical protein ASPZODRAFT_140315 [Penicilliopsis zonata CBS 506.65]|uniref:Uncharacterized protein n=1 Tax=Penicilliopsis zonata CBS 506.65 TaxID=1073090 RepID=A0A1L9SQP3_9EURO|nr:hypothetical protein ASPZODRAFT_140315 [Penicilliopsis zonata CBS 506.65]OJJ49414.1 hypothetical protein ASPZODRAFT_140315 [Penicilliopsis zonata CBS 506.65]